MVSIVIVVNCSLVLHRLDKSTWVCIAWAAISGDWSLVIELKGLLGVDSLNLHDSLSKAEQSQRLRTLRVRRLSPTPIVKVYEGFRDTGEINANSPQMLLAKGKAIAAGPKFDETMQREGCL